MAQCLVKFNRIVSALRFFLISFNFQIIFVLFPNSQKSAHYIFSYQQKVSVEPLHDNKTYSTSGNFAIPEKFKFEKPCDKYLLRYEQIYWSSTSAVALWGNRCATMQATRVGFPVEIMPADLPISSRC